MAENTGNKVEIKRQATRKSKIPRRLLSPKPWNQYTGLDPVVHHPQGNRLMPKTWMRVGMTILELLLKQTRQREPSETWNLVEFMEKKTGTYIALPVFNRMEDSSIEYN